MKKIATVLAALGMSLLGPGAVAETPLVYEASTSGSVGSGDFAPYYMMSNNGGVLTQPKSFTLRAKAYKDLSLSERFSFSFGVDALGGYQSEYTQYDLADYPIAGQGKHPSAVLLQQLYGEVKYRSLFLSMGMKERSSALFNSRLGSGDFIESNNARPIPQLRAGFVDFQDFPGTKGWLQIQGELSFGKMVENGWYDEHFSFRDGGVNLGKYYHYRRLYLRSNPDKPLSVTVGMQQTTQYGGVARTYKDGKIIKEDAVDMNLKNFFRPLLPIGGEEAEGNEGFYYGNTIGSWDLVARYRFADDTQLKAYFQWPFEDGSGIAKCNGFDGIWGLEYNNPNKKGIVAEAVIEYIDFTNQSGPIHWAPQFFDGQGMDGQATGNDNYYDNFRTFAYSNFGMSIGSPFISSTIYNRSGSNNIYDSRVRGVHLGASGFVLPSLEYRVLFSYRRSWGSYNLPRLELGENTSFMIEGAYHFPKIEGLSVKGQVAMDKGNMFGDNFGVLLALSYQGFLNVFGK